MSNQLIDCTAVLSELRTLSRGSLLVIAERAAELIPANLMGALLGDFVKLESCTGTATRPAAVLDDTRNFFDAAMAGDYYDTVEINNRSLQEQSAGTDAFAAEFDRLLRRCSRAAGQGEFVAARDSIKLLLALLRHIDKGNDDVLFFADEGGSSNVGVNWLSALPTYFNSLGATSSPAEFARAVISAIDEFVSYDRPHYLAAAHAVANDAQRVALATLAPSRI